MKRIVLPIFILTIILTTDNLYSQRTDFPIHLSIGALTRTIVNDTTVEVWDVVDDSELAVRTVTHA